MLGVLPLSFSHASPDVLGVLLLSCSHASPDALGCLAVVTLLPKRFNKARL